MRSQSRRFCPGLRTTNAIFLRRFLGHRYLVLSSQQLEPYVVLLSRQFLCLPDRENRDSAQLRREQDLHSSILARHRSCSGRLTVHPAVSTPPIRPTTLDDPDSFIPACRLILAAAHTHKQQEKTRRRGDLIPNSRHENCALATTDEHRVLRAARARKYIANVRKNVGICKQMSLVFTLDH